MNETRLGLVEARFADIVWENAPMTTRELVKGKVLEGALLTPREASDAICEATGADGVAIGRGAVGNPFVFGEIAAALGGAEYKAPTLEEKVATALWQLRLAIEDKGEGKAVPEARKQIASYLHSFKGAAKIRVKINQALTYAEIEKIFEDAMKDEIADS